MSYLKCFILGSGGSVNSVKRHNTSLLLQRENNSILVDCNGVCVQRLTSIGQAIETLEHIFLTHEHVDHIASICNLIHQMWVKACLYSANHKRTAALNIYGNIFTLNKTRRLIETLGLPNHPHIFPIVYHELQKQGGTISPAGIKIEYFPVDHGPTPCFGLAYRSERQGLVYSCDTEPRDTVFDRVRPGDILLHDCNKIDQAVNPEHTTWAQLKDRLPHLSCAKLYLLHLPLMTEDEETSFQEMLQADFGGAVLLGEDGQNFTVA